MSESEALHLDQQDPLSKFRDRFFIPRTKSGDEAIYFCGNSLGLQPRETRSALEQELDDWARLAVEGHFEARYPWYSYHEDLAEPLARLVGAKTHEVVSMGSLTNNLHLAMVSFYRPNTERFQILTEAGAFPSDRYAVESQARLHGFDPEEAVVTIGKKGELLDEADIESYLDKNGHKVALVLIGGVHYYSGQLFDMARITKAAQQAGAIVGV
ncbi:MAG TPA: kynureninase, partial [Myxococcales bacterium]|nr:kynureninase [Myxococcales bacterium]